MKVLLINGSPKKAGCTFTALNEVAKSLNEEGIETEIFVHGALCVSYSGQCLMSSMIGGRSGNRGRCAQPCRMEYTLQGEKSGEQRGYLLSPKDMCTIEDVKDIEIGSMIYAKKPGDGSAREQAASCQRVMGGLANICKEYATKRYRSNVMNWGMVPFQMEADAQFEVGDYIFVPNIRKALDGDMKDIKAYVISDNIKELDLYIADMTPDEKEIVKAGCLINYNRNRKENK